MTSPPNTPNDKKRKKQEYRAGLRFWWVSLPLSICLFLFGYIHSRRWTPLTVMVGLFAVMGFKDPGNLIFGVPAANLWSVIDNYMVIEKAHKEYPDKIPSSKKKS
jgi:hypothetical protein